MEAFKAANPGSVLGDFVRWYSPRDWIEEEVTEEDGTVRLVGKSLTVIFLSYEVPNMF
jgi:Rab3 GTPase-activating protein catalytic subunit